MGDLDAPHEVASIEIARARRFLRSLARYPFIAVVQEGERFRIYSKDMDPEHERIILALLEEEPEEA